MLLFFLSLMHFHHKSFFLCFISPKTLTTLILQYDLSMVLGEEFEFDETEYWESFISPFSYVVHYLKTIKIWDAASELNLALRITSEASLRNEENGVRFLNFFINSAIHLEKLTCITKPNFKGIHDIARMMGALPGAFSSAEILVCLWLVLWHCSKINIFLYRYNTKAT